MGPSSRELLSSVSRADFSDDAFPFGSSREVDLGYCTVRATRLTYVGERGWERPSHAAAGVGQVWVLQPDGCTLEASASRGARPVLAASAAGQGTVLLPPFAHPSDVGSLWKSPR